MGSNKHICVHKRMFSSEFVAQNHADQTNYEMRFDKISVYKCPYCNNYHLTSKDKKDK